MKTKNHLSTQLANAAKAYDWTQILLILKEHPDLINATRPGGKSLFTPLHQAVHGNAPLEVIQQLLHMGASLELKTAQGQSALEISQRTGNRGVQDFLQVYDYFLSQQDQLDFPDRVKNAQITCALRFMGYDYETAKVGKGELLLYKLVEPIEKNLILHPNNDDNFAAFFALQRHLFKWGGEYLTKYSEEHIAFDFLFLHLYALEPSRAFQHPEYCLEWQRKYAPDAETYAAIVRKSFRRVGAGKKSQLP
jgi:hypothetical protein